MLFTLQWWKDAGVRAARTAIVVLIPFFPQLSTLEGTRWDILASAALFGALASLLTSIVLVPEETSGTNVSRTKALVTRSLKSLAQGLLAGIGTATLFAEVDWGTAIQVGVSAAIGSFLLGLLSALPETPQVITPIPESKVIPSVPEGTTEVAVVGEDTVVYSEKDPES